MSWINYHTKSEHFAAEAEAAVYQGKVDLSIELYKAAAEAETIALDFIDITKVRTLGISIVSAVSLWYKAHDYKKAQNIAYRWMNSPDLPSFAIEQLQILLQTMWSNDARAEAGVNFSRGDIIVAVKGGQIITGGAPLDLIVRKVEGIQSLYYRAAEFLSNLPLRKHGPACADIQKMYKPWLFQTAPSSYQFVVAIQEPQQKELFVSGTPKGVDISDTFMKILRFAIDDPDKALTSIVPDPEYRGIFLKLARNLAPSGEVFEKLEVRSSLETKPVTFGGDVRQAISETIRRQFPKSLPKGEAKEVVLRGVLRGVHLDKDWLEIVSDGASILIKEVGEAVDDVVGPMVNHAVIVQAIKNKERYTLIDIQAEE